MVQEFILKNLKKWVKQFYWQVQPYLRWLL